MRERKDIQQTLHFRSLMFLLNFQITFSKFLYLSSLILCFFLLRNHCTKKMQFPADLVTFTEEILNEKLHFLCSVSSSLKWLHTPCTPKTNKSFKKYQAYHKVQFQTPFHIKASLHNGTYEDVLSLIAIPTTQSQTTVT